MKLLLQSALSEINAAIKITGSKSETNRLLLLKALFPNISLANTSNSDDSEVMQKALDGSDEIVDIHHAGTAMRFLTAYYAVTGAVKKMNGTPRMCERPIGILVDAFFLAFSIPNTFKRLFSEGTFNAAFVPSYSSLLNNKKKAQNFANSIFNLLTLGLIVLVLIVEILMPLFVYLIAPGFEGDYDKMELAITLTRITFPFLIFISLASFFSAILNSHNKFAIASAAPIILNILLIGVLLFAKILDDNLVYYLSYAVTISGVVQFIFLYFFVKKNFSPKIKFKININKKIKNFFKKLLPSIFSSGVTQINILVGTIIASFQASAVSYLYYADRTNQLPLAMIGIAISTALLPSLSRLIKSNKADEAIKLQNIGLEVALIMAIPATISLIIFAHPIITTLFERGKFTSDESLLVSKALMLYSVGLPAFILVKIFEPAFFARGNTRTPMNISILSVAINCFCNFCQGSFAPSFRLPSSFKRYEKGFLKLGA